MSLLTLFILQVPSPGRMAVLNLARINLSDMGTSFQAQVFGDDKSTRFDLPYELIETDPAKLTVTINDSGVLSRLMQGTPPYPGQYSIEPRQGVITLGSPLLATQTLYVQGIHYSKYTTNDLNLFMDAAFAQHTKGRTISTQTVVSGFTTFSSTPYTWDTLPVVEQYPLSLLVALEALWGEVAGASNEIDVSTPEGMHIPEGQRFQQLLAAIQPLEAQYKELCAMMNIGLYRIEMFTLRRVSRMTGRLVPVYVEQEWDDNNPPTRIYPPIDTGAL